MAIVNHFAYNGAHGSSTYNQWRSSSGMQAGRTSGGADCRCVWAFNSLVGITDPIKSITFNARRNDTYSSPKTLRCWWGERSQNPVTSVSWSQTQNWALQVTGINQGWLSVDLTSQITALKAVPDTSSIVVGLMQHSGTSNNYSLWTWGSSATTASYRAYLQVETFDGVVWYNDNGTWRRCSAWYNDGGTWKRCLPFYNNGGTWVRT